MKLNTISPKLNSKPRAKPRLGRGIGTGLGKTAGRGHKGAKSRSGSHLKIGFEGGQMPIQRRLPKFGFNSRKLKRTTEVRLEQLSSLKDELIDINTLKRTGLLRKKEDKVRVILGRKIDKPVNPLDSQLYCTKGTITAMKSCKELEH